MKQHKNDDVTCSRPIVPQRKWVQAVVVVLAFTLCIAIVTWPYPKTITTHLPSDGDPLQHLWIMKWYEQCLDEGKFPYHCAELQYPTGASIANFSPLHLQSALFLATGLASSNDALRYNLVWYSGFLMTALGTYLLGCRMIRSRLGAFVAGLLVMVSGPVMIHSHAHLELVFVGVFPLFMLAWINFLDRPTLRRAFIAAVAYVLLASSAAYFMVFGIFPALLYFLWRGFLRPRDYRVSWFISRTRWSGLFTLFTLPLLLVLFSGQLIEILEGDTIHRPRSEFDQYGMPWWGYVIPPSANYLSQLFSFDPYKLANISGEGTGYLGIVTLLLLYVAWHRRTTLRKSNYWWSLALLLVVLSIGSSLQYKSSGISFPAGWLRDLDWFVPFQLIRVPARFKLFVPVCTGLLAGAAWAACCKARKRLVSLGATILLSLFILVDLGHQPYYATPLPRLPLGYLWLLDHDPHANWLELPQSSSGDAHAVYGRLTYWQSLHQGRTTVGYSGHPNRSYDDRYSWGSPLAERWLTVPEATDPPRNAFDIIETDASRAESTWLYLNSAQLRYIVFHNWLDDPSFRHRQIMSLLDDALIYSDAELSIFDRELLPTPTHLTAVTTTGWGPLEFVPRMGFVRLPRTEATITLYNPQESNILQLDLTARTFGKSTTLRLQTEDGELERWTIGPGEPHTHKSLPFRISQGIHEIHLIADSEVEQSEVQQLFERVTTPAAYVASKVRIHVSSE